MKVLIMSGGVPPCKELIMKELEDSGIVIAADSGGNALYNLDIMPHYLVGDFDSINKDVYDIIKQSGTEIKQFPSEKDFTDTELALLLSVEIGASEIIFLGCTGSRVDHLLGNFGLLKRCLDLKIKASIRDNNNIIFLTDKSIQLRGKCGQIFSLQAYCDTVNELSVKGAKYNLDKYDLRLGEPKTVSNEFTTSPVNIDFEDGILMVILSKD
jgi:thiamine pyrophosphokinase